jgi:HlyD family secretion protein
MACRRNDAMSQCQLPAKPLSLQDMTKTTLTRAHRAAIGLAQIFLPAGLAITGVSQLCAAGPPEPQASKGPVVTVARAKKACFDNVVEIPGAFAAKREAPVWPDREGLQISQVLVEEGDKVEAGQEMAELVNPEAQPGGSSVPVRAPAAGVVSFAGAAIGAIASARALPLFRIIAGGELEFSAQLPVKYVSRLSIGLPAKIKVPGIGELDGRVTFVSKAVDPSTQAGEVRRRLRPAESRNAGTGLHKLRPEMRWHRRSPLGVALQ